MAEVITWRQMAGPNFSGTAAAMDAGADRINQMATTFQQLAQDQTRIQAEAKAKRRSENTARALSELSSINDLNALNQQMPNFSYDSLTGRYGEDIDAGLVSQTAAKQAGVIQENQLREMDFNIAKEKPIMGKASEEIAGLLNKGDFDGADALYKTYMPQLTDATPLANMITDARTKKAQADRDAASDLRDSERLKLDQQQGQRVQDMYNADIALGENLRRQAEDIGLGKQDGLILNIPKGADPVKAMGAFRELNTYLVEQSNLPEAKKQELLTSKAKYDFEYITQKAQADNVLSTIKENLPTYHPEVDQFFKTLPKDIATALTTVSTPEGALEAGLKAAGIEPEEHFFDDWIEYGKDEIQSKLKSKGIDLKDYSPVVVAAAVSGISKTSDGKLTNSDITELAVRLDEYGKDKATYDKNTRDYKLIERAFNTELKDLEKHYIELDDLQRRIAIADQKHEIAFNYSSLTGKAADTPIDQEMNGESLIVERDKLLKKIAAKKQSLVNYGNTELNILAQKLNDEEAEKNKNKNK